MLRRLIVVVAVAVASCKSSTNQPGKAAASGEAAQSESILIGATLPLTGAESRVGALYKEGYDLAFEEANAAGGIAVGAAKQKVRLELLDDTSTQATATSLADRLINSDKVQFLLGTYSSHLVEAQSVVAEQNAIPYVNGGGGAVDIYKRGYKWLFGLLAPVQLLAKAEMGWIAAQQQAGKLPTPIRTAVLWENTAHGKDFRAGVREFAAENPGHVNVVVDESFELGGKDYSALLGKVKAAHVDVFLADAHLPDFIAMQRQYVTLGLCHKVQSYGARGSERDAASALGAEHVAYILSSVWWSPQLGTMGLARKFVDSFRARYNREPEWYQALAYETARALFVAIGQAGSTDRDKVREKLASMNIESILAGGKLSFPAANGQQAHYPFVVQQNQPDGSSPIVWPRLAARADGVAPNPACP